MLTGILILTIVGLLAVLSHRRTRLENKIYKNVPLVDWLNFSAYPIALYIGWFIVVKNIISRPYADIFPLGDFDILAVTILFMVYGFVGNSIHFTGKILWRYLVREKHGIAYRVNEMFHGRFSHYLIYLNVMFIIFLLAMLEVNHPLPAFVTNNYLKLIAFGGIAFGYLGSKTVFYSNEWFGGYNKPLFFIMTIFAALLLLINRFYNMNYSYYPVNFFTVTMCTSFLSAFIIRQFIIFSRLNSRRRFRFLAKIFSA